MDYDQKQLLHDKAVEELFRFLILDNSPFLHHREAELRCVDVYIRNINTVDPWEGEYLDIYGRVVFARSPQNYNVEIDFDVVCGHSIYRFDKMVFPAVIAYYRLTNNTHIRIPVGEMFDMITLMNM